MIEGIDHVEDTLLFHESSDVARGETVGAHFRAACSPIQWTKQLRIYGVRHDLGRANVALGAQDAYGFPAPPDRVIRVSERVCTERLKWNGKHLFDVLLR